MARLPVTSDRSLVSAQLLLATGAIVAIALVPPARGRMLVIPLASAGQGDAIRIALDHGARLIDQGPLERSIVVDGDRSLLAGPLAAAGMGITSAPGGGCGERGRR